jgi:hypothetical protein
MNATATHAGLAAGSWHTLSLIEQLGNIGSEVSRARVAQKKGNTQRMQSALFRALELIDLTIADPRHAKRLKELCRTREILCDFFVGDNEYASTGEELDRYFLHYAIAARSTPR